MPHKCMGMTAGILCAVAGLPDSVILCRKHWFKVPKVLRDDLWSNYKPGQEERLTATREYMTILKEVIKAAQV